MYGEAFAKCYVVFLSNEQRAVPLWKQKNAKSKDKPVIWVRKYQVFFSRYTITKFDMFKNISQAQLGTDTPATQPKLAQVSR